MYAEWASVENGEMPLRFNVKAFQVLIDAFVEDLWKIKLYKFRPKARHKRESNIKSYAWLQSHVDLSIQMSAKVVWSIEYFTFQLVIKRMNYGKNNWWTMFRS